MVNIWKCESDYLSFFSILNMHIKYLQVYINTSIISWALSILGLSSIKFNDPFEFKASESLAASCFVTTSRIPKHKYYLGKLQTCINSQTEIQDKKVGDLMPLIMILSSSLICNSFWITSEWQEATKWQHVSLSEWYLCTVWIKAKIGKFHDTTNVVEWSEVKGNVGSLKAFSEMWSSGGEAFSDFGALGL